MTKENKEIPIVTIGEKDGKPSFEVTLIDAREMYQHICSNAAYFGSNPVQFIPVLKLPEWVKIEHRSEPCILIHEVEGVTDVCLIVNSPNLLHVIDKIARNEIDCIKYIVPSISDCLGLSFQTQISGKKLMKLYTNALQIVDRLQLSYMSVIILVGQDMLGELNGNHLIIHIAANEFAGLLFLNPAGALMNTFFLAHEYRHMWQSVESDGKWNDYKDYAQNVNVCEYNQQLEEIDANAFACSYMEELGYDWMKIYPCENFIELRELRKRIKVIKKDAIAA